MSRMILFLLLHSNGMVGGARLGGKKKKIEGDKTTTHPPRLILFLIELRVLKHPKTINLSSRPRTTPASAKLDVFQLNFH